MLVLEALSFSFILQRDFRYCETNIDKMRYCMFSCCNLNQWSLDGVGNEERILEAVRRVPNKAQTSSSHLK